MLARFMDSRVVPDSAPALPSRGAALAPNQGDGKARTPLPPASALGNMAPLRKGLCEPRPKHRAR